MILTIFFLILQLPFDYMQWESDRLKSGLGQYVKGKGRVSMTYEKKKKTKKEGGSKREGATI